MRYAIAQNAKQFNDIFEDSTLFADVSTPAAEKHYEELDSELNARLRHLLSQALPRDAYHVNDDWWPNHTRYAYVNARHLTEDLLERIRGLLVAPYEDWRVQVVAHDSTDNQLGCALVHAHHTLIEPELCALLRVDAPPSKPR